MAEKDKNNKVQSDEKSTNESPDSNEISYLTYEDVISEQSEKAAEYHKITVRLSLFTTIFSLILLTIFVIFRVPNFLRDISPFGNQYSFLTVAFVTIVFFLIDFLISFPISYYSEIIERRYEFATRNTKSWFIDKLKELGITVIILLVIIEALFAGLFFQPDIWWIYAFLGYFIFAGIMSSISPFLISIFTKIEPLEDGEIRSVVEDIAKQMNLEYEEIYNWNMSEQTTKANAAVVGFGSTIRIMLGDTLTSNFRPDEIEVVMAHEIAHQQNKDVYRGILFNGFIALIAFYLVDLGFDFALANFGLTSKSDPASIGYIWLTLSISLELLGKISLWYSRRREKAADIVAIKQLRNIEIYESAFARLSKQNLSFPNPSKLEIIWRYSHPPVRERIKYAKKFAAN